MDSEGVADGPYMPVIGSNGKEDELVTVLLETLLRIGGDVTSLRTGPRKASVRGCKRPARMRDGGTAGGAEAPAGILISNELVGAGV